MKKEDFEKLKLGDIVRHHGSGTGYIITGDQGDTKIATHTIEICNPSEWQLIFKAAHTKQQTQD